MELVDEIDTPEKMYLVLPLIAVCSSVNCSAVVFNTTRTNFSVIETECDRTEIDTILISVKLEHGPTAQSKLKICSE